MCLNLSISNSWFLPYISKLHYLRLQLTDLIVLSMLPMLLGLELAHRGYFWYVLTGRLMMCLLLRMQMNYMFQLLVLICQRIIISLDILIQLLQDFVLHLVVENIWGTLAHPIGLLTIFPFRRQNGDILFHPPDWVLQVFIEYQLLGQLVHKLLILISDLLIFQQQLLWLQFILFIFLH